MQQNLPAKVKSSAGLTDNILDYVAKGRTGGATFFEDGRRKVYYILVISLSSTSKNVEIMQEAIRKLEDMGLEFEQDLGIGIPVKFIKIHISDYLAKHYIYTYDIQKEYLDNFNYTDVKPDHCSFFKIPPLKKDPFSGLSMESLTINKIRIINTMLKHVSFGSDEDMKEFKPESVFKNSKRKVDACWYIGENYPPGHELEYQKTENYYYINYYKSFNVIVLELIILFFYVLIQILIPKVPLSIKKLTGIDRTNISNPYNKIFNENLDIAPLDYVNESNVKLTNEEETNEDPEYEELDDEENEEETNEKPEYDDEDEDEEQDDDENDHLFRYRR
ncbi:unnamed protein product [Brassicogethes aeneus]|uniref:Anoctamin dimerisation domain-containing protein n=1 Tax=Brassicogethes aeneus TaxID=1431903 RepID=A0A9P0BJS2_BRAAE|nr:unnamed protein product [Brassicogethes aeneus]